MYVQMSAVGLSGSEYIANIKFATSAKVIS